MSLRRGGRGRFCLRTRPAVVIEPRREERPGLTAAQPEPRAAFGETLPAVEAVLQSSLTEIVDVTAAERGFFMLRDGNLVVACNGDQSTAPHSAFDDAARALAQAAIRSGEATFRAAPERGSGTVACMPLRLRDEVIGALFLDVPAHEPLPPAERRLMLALTRQVALAVEGARMLEDERERLARVSALQAFGTRILEAIANGVITFSPSRAITTFNRAAEKTFGVRAEEMVGRPAATIAAVIPDFPELFETFFQSGAVQLRAEVEARARQGPLLTLEMQLAPFEGASGTGVAMLVTDVTKQRSLEVAHEADLEKARRVEETFSRYLAPHVVASLMHDPASIKLGGERRRATTLFADVRGFTRLATDLAVDRVVEILNSYFEEAVQIIFEHDGLLDKFYGDGLMAIFGPPAVRDDDAARAVAAAIGLHEGVTRLGPRLRYPLRISVGLATGDVVAGHFGSLRRMDYTVIGDAVNLANGLQAAAPPGAIYCDEETILRAGLIARPVQRLEARIKGRDELVTAYAIFPLSAPR